jgi:hypothetical protein
LFGSIVIGGGAEYVFLPPVCVGLTAGGEAVADGAGFAVALPAGAVFVLDVLLSLPHAAASMAQTAAQINMNFIEYVLRDSKAITIAAVRGRFMRIL